LTVLTRRVPTPTLRVERSLWRVGRERVAGLDEVGMACLAGPVVAAAVVLKPNCRMLPGVRDSKTLSLQQREQLFARLRGRILCAGVGAASPSEIDRLNILRASHLAMARAVRRVQPLDHVLLDGRDFRDLDIGPHTAIVDGDAKSYAIACASIVAKVLRDRLMTRLASRYPGYGWEINVGYATRRHRDGLRELGVSPLHRRTFGTVRAMLAPADQLPLALDAESLLEAEAEAVAAIAAG
jgi:ribonuclease HII